MHHAIWKLTALAGVVGIGLLVVMQAQQGLKNGDLPQDGAEVALGEPASSDAPADGRFHAHRERDTIDDQGEPVPASVKGQMAVVDSGNETSTVAGRGRHHRSTADTDPFAEAEVPAEPVRQLPASARLRSRLEQQRIAEEEALLAEQQQDEADQRRASANPKVTHPKHGAAAVAVEIPDLTEEAEEADPAEQLVADNRGSGSRNRNAREAARVEEQEPEDSAPVEVEADVTVSETLITRNEPAQSQPEMADEEEEEVIERPVVSRNGQPNRNRLPEVETPEVVLADSDEPVVLAPATISSTPSAAEPEETNVAALPAIEEEPDDAITRQRQNRDRQRQPELAAGNNAATINTPPADDTNFAAPVLDNLPATREPEPENKVAPVAERPRHGKLARSAPALGNTDDDADFGTRPATPRGPQLTAGSGSQHQRNQPRNQDPVTETDVEPAAPSRQPVSLNAPESAGPPGRFRDDDGFPHAAPARSTVPKTHRPGLALATPAADREVAMASHASDDADFAQDPPAHRTKAQETAEPSKKHGTLEPAHNAPRLASVSPHSSHASQPANNATPRPHLTIDKIAPASAAINHPLVYQIIVRNVGALPAGQVMVEDRIPHGVQLNGTIPQAHLAGDRLTWKLGTVAPGQEKKISVRIVPSNEGVVGSVATVSFAADIAAQTLVTAPKLKFELLAPPRATLNSPVVFTFRVTNTSNSDASGIFIRNVLPAGLRHPDGDDLEFEVGTLAPGKSREVQLALNAVQLGRTVNRAVVTGDGGISSQAEAEVEVRGPSLTVVRTGPKRLFLNKAGVFINRVTNEGAAPLVNIRVVETVPVGMQPLNATAGSHFDPQRRTITWNVGRLEAGQSVDLDVRLNLVGRGPQVSVVRANDASGATGETMSTITAAGVAALGIEMTEIPLPVEVGEKVTCRVRIINRGSEPATNVRATVVLPRGMQLVAAQGATQYTQSGDQLQFDGIARLEARGETTIDLTLQARHAGDGRLQTVVQCDQMSQPLQRDEATSIVAAP